MLIMGITGLESRQNSCDHESVREKMNQTIALS